MSVLRDNLDTQSTYLYLQILKYIIISFIDKSTSIQNRLYYSWLAVFFCRLWLMWLKNQSFTNTSTKKIDTNKAKYFITMPAYWSLEINTHNLLYLVLLVQQQQLPRDALNIFLFNSQPCESIFRNARALSGCYSTRVNFTVDDFLRRAEKITVLQQIKCEEQSNRQKNHLVFPVHHKHQKDDHSSFQQRADDGAFDVEEIIKRAYKQAQKFAVTLKMSALLKQNQAFELNDLSSSIKKHLARARKVKDSLKLNPDEDVSMDESSSREFDDESANDEFNENDDSDGSDDDHNDNNNDGGDVYDLGSLESDDEIGTIATEKTTFHGMRIRNSIGTNLTDSYFRVIINNTEKYIHKQTACWMLTENNILLSSDQLSRVIDASKKE